MQNQKTPPQKTEISLGDLSPEEQAFAEELALSDNQSQAYRNAYGAEGYSPNALKVRACRKAAEPKIKNYVAALRGAGLANARLTLEQRIADERAFAQRAEDAGNFGAAGGAYDRLNKLLGLYVERHMEMDSDPISALEQIAKEFGPDIARQLATKEGVSWAPQDEPPPSLN
jgi:hypothetical protein